MVHKQAPLEDDMIHAKFSLDEPQVKFLSHHKEYGFKDKSAVIRAALDRLQKEIEQEKLKMSAEAYAKLYDDDKEIRKLTESAIAGWPE